ncbi:hypothetical protein FNV43_RR04563 [Rhamnella rubrinervis]|uniref:Uncharacterized protein n=1 Tax=Rhamnella rubrinervis TaxID=2594499 RepID=A0A8K0MPN9_9ROSA|nr:hypothetical protein FNV43_RR04563 [Rhamnella rubrinervis]
MESPGSDLAVEEQLVRKNSNRGASSSSGTPRPRQADKPNVETPTRTPSIRVDGPSGNRSGLITMRPVIIKTDIHSVFKQSDMSYLKERFDMPSQIKLSAPGPLERADSPRDREATKKKKKDKQAAAKGGASSASDKGQERPTLNVVVEPSSLPIAIPSGDSPPPKRPRRSSPPAPAQDKGKEKQTTSMLGLEDSSTIRSDSSLVGPIVDYLLTRHDRSLLREMTFDEVGLEAEQNALKLAQNARYLYDVVIKVDKTFKKKADSYNNAVAANKNLEESNLALKQTAEELEAPDFDYARVLWERMRGRVARWPRAKHIYKKATIAPSSKHQRHDRMLKVGQVKAGHSPGEDEGGQEDIEITSGEDEPDEGDAPP